MAHRGPTAWVGDYGDGSSRFSALVDYGEDDGPFSSMIGPDGVSAGQAVTWARRHARRVIVRVGDKHFSAGEESHPRFPHWPGAAEPPDDGDEGGTIRLWRVEGRTGWFRPDGSEVASRLADVVAAQPAVSDVSHGPTEAGFRVSFSLTADSLVAARELASPVLRSGWAATGVEAVPGDDSICPRST